jgi:chromosome segregation ATPase
MPMESGVLVDKLDFLTKKVDDYKEILVKNEIEKAKLHLKLEMSQKIEEIEKEFNKKILQAKKASETVVLKLKSTFNKENASLKETIKYLYDEISDYKSQVNSQEYKIDLYKEKIITYEKERKSQTDHAELLRVLVQKLNSFLNNR